MQTEIKAAGIPVRAVAVIIDALITFVGFGTLIGLVTGDAHRSGGTVGFHLNGAPALVLFAASFAYWIVCEHLLGYTIGKRLFGIRVVGADGGNPGWGASIGRNLLRVVDAFPYVLPYLVGFIAAISGAERRRLGDLAAGTRVIQR